MISSFTTPTHGLSKLFLIDIIYIFYVIGEEDLQKMVCWCNIYYTSKYKYMFDRTVIFSSIFNDVATSFLMTNGFIKNLLTLHSMWVVILVPFCLRSCIKDPGEQRSSRKAQWFLVCWFASLEDSFLSCAILSTIL